MNRGKRVFDLARGTSARVISDLHAGHGRFSDIFAGKDALLESFIEDTIRNVGALVLAGDIFELWQCNIERAREVHPGLFRALERAAENVRTVFIPGNHDAMSEFPVPGVEVADEVRLAPDVRLVHGDEFDLYYKSLVSTRGLPRTLVALHNFIEQRFGAHLRWPLRDFPNALNRVGLRLQYPYGVWKEVVREIAHEFGWTRVERNAELFLEYWVRGQSGDPSAMLVPACASLGGDTTTLVCGHSHVPGIVERPEGRYVNIGSWTHGNAECGEWRDGNVRVLDVRSGREFDDALYRHLFDEPLPTFTEWWRRHYRGALDFEFE